ncbi:hypothetical protein F8388_009542 [Cannabis sativa]|uniref:Uncharacterized protein n=1 Tax=Cannabis sativa TaxID=3483 RepID=A0A7J6H979_CANSA|nr:hypothetical protein F8388_009542 [Cannabis sativa]
MEGFNTFGMGNGEESDYDEELNENNDVPTKNSETFEANDEFACISPYSLSHKPQLLPFHWFSVIFSGRFGRSFSHLLWFGPSVLGSISSSVELLTSIALSLSLTLKILFQEEGWPLGLQPLNARVGLARNRDFSESISFNTLISGSPTCSTNSSSDDDGMKEIASTFKIMFEHSIEQMRLMVQGTTSSR